MKLLFLLIVTALFLEANVNVVCKAGIMDNYNAKKYINKLLKKEPKNIECILKLANIHLKSGKILNGYKYIARAYDINPEEVKQSEVSSIYLYALEINELEKRAKNTNDKSLWNKLGDNFFEMGVYQESASAYKNSMDLDETQTDIGLKLALSYKKSNNIFKALEELKLLVALNSEDFYVNYYLGKILKHDVKDSDKAKEYFVKAQQVLEIDKQSIAKDKYFSLLHDIEVELRK